MCIINKEDIGEIQVTCAPDVCVAAMALVSELLINRLNLDRRDPKSPSILAVYDLEMSLFFSDDEISYGFTLYCCSFCLSLAEYAS